MHLSKKCSVFKVVLSALLIVALLQLIYLSFLSKFHGKQQRYRYSELFGGSGKKNGGAQHHEKNSRKERLRYSLSTGGIFDHSGQYRVYKNLIKSDYTANHSPGADANVNVLALATHTTIGNLHYLDSLLERWQNPLSVAVFAHGQDVKYATALAYALSVFCPQVQALVDFHLVCLSGEMASFPEQDLEHFVGLEDCASVFSRLETHRYRYSELFGGSGKKNGGAQHHEKNSRKERLRYSLSTGGIFDHSGQYRVYKNLIKSDYTANHSPGADANVNVLALATHTTIGNLHYLDSLLERWQNPLSVAVFAHGQDVKYATALAYALSVFCPQVQALVDFHLVCLSGEMASFPEQDLEHFVGLEDCASVFSRLETHRDKYKNYAIGGNVSYPNNLLRNVARATTETAYVLVIDMDMVPSADLHQQFLAMVARQEPDSNEVFVLPAFEIRHVRKLPATKSELVQLYQVGEVRPFYEELCPRCHAPTNYSRWVNSHARGAAGGPLEVAYTLAWVDPWEPFYIGPRTVPLYDENFKQYGFNRISQACELHVSGYKFSVLSSAFVVHRGFKVQGEFHSQKDEENKRNRVLFRSFKEGLKTKYPTSTRRC